MPLAMERKKLYQFGDIDVVYNLKKMYPDYVLMGERHGQKPSGFDYGNSPTDIEFIDFSGKTIIQTTSASTQGIVNAINAEEIITGSFVNAQAIIEYIRNKSCQQVSLVCMGFAAKRSSDEDTLCAQYIRDRLMNKQTNFEEIVKHLKKYESSLDFFNPEKTWKPEKDFELCMKLDRFDFVLKADLQSDGLYILNRVTTKLV